MTGALLQSKFRPYLILAAVIALLTIVDAGSGRFLSAATAYSTLQSLSTFSLVALGLGLTMLIGEFDLSVAGVFGLAGCVAVLTGSASAWLGLAAALAVGIAFGLVQGLIITGLELGSVAVTLGGLLTASGSAYVITHNQTISSDDLDLAMMLNDRIAFLFSLRSLVALCVFAICAVVFATTRLGRDLVAIGSDRRAAIIAGVSVRRLVVGAFAFSGLMAATGGALLSYGLASASPSGLSDVLVPAAAAAILGGVSLAGGTGTPLGILAGVLTLTVLRTGLNALAAPPFAHDLATGCILVLVAASDAPYFARRLSWLASRLRRSSEPTQRQIGVSK
jgi:ribose/xylose/arabinose/galactoside ABC-type transport system permease subunit